MDIQGLGNAIHEACSVIGPFYKDFYDAFEDRPKELGLTDQFVLKAVLESKNNITAVSNSPLSSIYLDDIGMLIE